MALMTEVMREVQEILIELLSGATSSLNRDLLKGFRCLGAHLGLLGSPGLI